MAKYERQITGDFDEILDVCEKAVSRGSLSATYEGGSDFTLGGTRVAVRVFERYSALGKNRVSLNIVLAGDGSTVYLTAITAGGSQAVFLKINTFGEENFLSNFVSALERRFPL